MKSDELFNQGITISDSSRLDVRGEVTAGKDCSIDVNVILEGSITLGDNVSIGPNTIIKDSIIGSNTKIEAFTILSNHYHLLLRCDNFINLQHTLKQINGASSFYINKRINNYFFNFF